MEEEFTRQEFVALLTEHGLNKVEAEDLWDSRPSDTLDPAKLIASAKRALPIAKALRKLGASK